MSDTTDLNLLLHDLNQPLSVIQGNVELLEMKCGNCDKAVKHLSAISRSVNRVEEIVIKLSGYCETLIKE